MAEAGATSVFPLVDFFLAEGAGSGSYASGAVDCARRLVLLVGILFFVVVLGINICPKEALVSKMTVREDL